MLYVAVQAPLVPRLGPELHGEGGDHVGCIQLYQGIVNLVYFFRIFFEKKWKKEISYF